MSFRTEGWTQGFTNKRKSLKESYWMVSFVLIIKTTDTVRRLNQAHWLLCFCFSFPLCVPKLYCLQIQSHSLLFHFHKQKNFLKVFYLFLVEWYCFTINQILLLFVSNSFVTPWTVAHHVPLSMGFSRQEYSFSSHKYTCIFSFLSLLPTPSSYPCMLLHSTSLCYVANTH